MTKIPSHEIKELFEVEAINIDKGYVTLKGTPEKGSVRITFAEIIPGIEEIKARVAVNMSHETMSELCNILQQVLQMMQPAKLEDKDIVENTEQPKDDTPVLQ